jgi:hypothetical protein
MAAMKIQPNDIQNLKFLWQKQLAFRKTWKTVLIALVAIFPMFYIPFAASIPSPWNMISITIVALAVAGLGFLNRISLIQNKTFFGKKREYRHLLDFAESDDYKLSPEEALAQMEFRRKDAWRM